MKQLIKIGFFIFFLSATSCYGQKMVQKTNDAKKLEMNKEQFIGKPLKVLLEQIEPKIKLVYGNPENTWAGAIGGTYLKFHFVDGDEWREIHKKNQKPIGITVSFQLEPNNTRKPLPKEGLKEWKSEDTMEYGDMIILNVRVSGEK